MAFLTYDVQNPETCKGPREVLGDERTDWGGPQKLYVIREQTERWLGARLDRFQEGQVISVTGVFHYNLDNV
jgi:hypothetical protein